MKKCWFTLLIFALLGLALGTIGKEAVLPETPEPTQQTETLAITPTATPTTEEESIITPTAATPDLTAMRINRRIFTSPDGQWLAEFVMAFSETYEEGVVPLFYTGLTVRSVDGEKEWRILDKWAKEGLGMHYPQPVLWSKDGHSFYYTNLVVPDGCSGVFNNGSDLYKVDLATGKVNEVLSSGPTWLALSPDERTLAYSEPYGRGIVLLDLDSGEEQTVPLERKDQSKTYEMKIVWSPNGKTLVVTLAANACFSVGDGEYTSILLVDAQSLEVKPIIVEDKRYRVAEEWLDSEQLVLRDVKGRRWVWNMQTAVLTMLEGESIPTIGTCPAATATP